MFWRFLRASALSLVAILFVSQFAVARAARPPLVAYVQIAMFSSESAAQAHCPRDVVVWLNTKTGIWHEKGMRWYGRTKYGAYVCRREAAAAGYRDTENGQ